MTVEDLVALLGLEVVTGRAGLDTEVTGGYASDLLSDVMANARKGNVWVTLQVHENIVAVASLKELSGILTINSRTPLAPTIAKAERENMPILVCELPAFEVIGRLYAAGLRGSMSHGDVEET